MVLEKLENHLKICRNMRLDPCLIPLTEINSKLKTNYKIIRREQRVEDS